MGLDLLLLDEDIDDCCSFPLLPSLPLKLSLGGLVDVDICNRLNCRAFVALLEKLLGGTAGEKPEARIVFILNDSNRLDDILESPQRSDNPNRRQLLKHRSGDVKMGKFRRQQSTCNVNDLGWVAVGVSILVF